MWTHSEAAPSHELGRAANPASHGQDTTAGLASLRTRPCPSATKNAVNTSLLTTTEEEHSSSKRFEENIPELFSLLC